MRKTGHVCCGTILHEGVIKVEVDLEVGVEDEEEAKLYATTATSRDTFLENSRTLARHVSIGMILIMLLNISLNF